MDRGECDVKASSGKSCKSCKHCEEYKALDLEYLCPEPAYRCKAKNYGILFIGLPRPFCKLFEPKSESSEIYSAAIDKLKDACINMGSNAESVSRILRAMAETTIETQKLAHLETNYKIVSDLQILEGELKPCSVCGGKPRMQMSTDYSYDLGERITYQIGCPGRCGQIFSGFNLDSLIKSWNRYAEGMITRPTIKPKSTNCPNCGAPVDIHAEKCAYCDTPYI